MKLDALIRWVKVVYATELAHAKKQDKQGNLEIDIFIDSSSGNNSYQPNQPAIISSSDVMNKMDNS